MWPPSWPRSVAVPRRRESNSSGETLQNVEVRGKRSPSGTRSRSWTLQRAAHRRYGYPIGVATADIKQGDHVHSHNMRSALSPASAKKRRHAKFVPPNGSPKTAEVSACGGGLAPMRPTPWRPLSVRRTCAEWRRTVAAAAALHNPYQSRGRGPPRRSQRRAAWWPARSTAGMVSGITLQPSAAKAVSDAARQYGIAIALVRNSNHFGFAGYYAR